MTILELVQNLGIFTIMVGAIAWVVRALTKQMLNRDLEKFKSDLALDAITHKIRYEQLHAERVEVTKEVYKKIVRVHDSLRSLIMPFQPAGELTENEKSKIAKKHSDDLLSYYDENRIFFDESLAKEIDNYLVKLRGVWTDFQQSRLTASNKDYNITSQKYDNALTEMTEIIPSVKKQLEDRFRNILGLNNQ